MNLTATYSPEDNALRLRADERLPPELFTRIKNAGFKWAPVQKLFVAHRWTPSREDLCLELAGFITAEESTMAERAEAKIDRLTNLAIKRSQQANGYREAADRISQNFAAGQPILVGHHSERKARKDQQAMERNQELAQKAADAVDYWSYRAQGVAYHANQKNNTRTRNNRIKKLLKELREHQNQINHGNILHRLWTQINDDFTHDPDKGRKIIEYYAGGGLKTGRTLPDYAHTYGYALENHEITHEEIIQRGLAYAERLRDGEYNRRWLSHILNRLGYERSELGETARYNDDLSAGMVQTFFRTHGAHKPVAKLEDDTWTISSTTPLPAHLANGNETSLSDADLRDLMQSVGYEVPAPRAANRSTAKKPPIVNINEEDAQRLQDIWNAKHKAYSEQHKYVKYTEMSVLRMSQARFSDNSKGDYSPFKIIEIDNEGKRVDYSYRTGTKVASSTPVCRIRIAHANHYHGADRPIVIEDKPTKPLPITWEPLQETEEHAA